MALFEHTHSDGSVNGTGELAKPEHFLLPDAPQHKEIAGASAPAVWIEKNPNGGFATYPKRDQGQKGDCTCYTAAKLLAIDELQENGYWRDLSPDSVYPYVCQSGGGASSIDVFNFTLSKGMALEALYASDGLSESQAEDSSKIPLDAKLIAPLYRPAQVIQCPTDFETIASILYGYQQQGIKKAVAITVIGYNNGSWRSPFPEPTASPTGPWYHKVPVVDFGLVNGQKFLAIDNSWGSSAGIGGQQFLGQNYEGSMYGGQYLINLPDSYQAMTPSTVPPPKHQWTTQLQTGSTGPDVLALQQALQSLGMFPVSSVIKPTGNYFGITKAAVVLFQANFGLTQTGVVDQPTIDKLNGIFK